MRSREAGEAVPQLPSFKGKESKINKNKFRCPIYPIVWIRKLFSFSFHQFYVTFYLKLLNSPIYVKTVGRAAQ